MEGSGTSDQQVSDALQAFFQSSSAFFSNSCHKDGRVCQNMLVCESSYHCRDSAKHPQRQARSHPAGKSQCLHVLWDILTGLATLQLAILHSMPTTPVGCSSWSCRRFSWCFVVVLVFSELVEVPAVILYCGGGGGTSVAAGMCW